MLDGNTPLLASAQKGRTEVVDMLLAAGARVDQVNRLGATALNLACKNGHLETAKILVAADADPTIKTRAGKDVLMEASDSDQADVVAWLSLTFPEGSNVMWRRL